ncbi:MAG: ABC transporter permease [Candidatus Angelobacter sp.]
MFRKRALKDLDQDLQDHLEMETDDNIERGMHPEEARSVALRKLGNVALIKEQTRETWGFVWLEQLLQDLRYSARMLRKSPAFTLVVILTLALGIGANTAIFSVVQGVMLAPLPYHAPDRLVLIWQSNRNAPHVSMSLPDFRDWQRDAQSFERIAAERWFEFNLSSPGLPEHVNGYEISSNFFTTLGVQPSLGREFSSDEDHADGVPVALLSNKQWKNRFGGSRQVLGKSITLDGVAYTIVGVAPQDFKVASDVDVFIPLGQGDPTFNNRRYPGVLCIARLKPGISIQQAQSEMTNLQQGLDKLYPSTDQGLGTDVVPLKSVIVGDISGTLLLMLGAVAVVLLIACANVANLLLARSVARSREFVLRSALGAQRTRLARQLLTESIFLSLAGGIAGLAIAKLGIHAVLAMLEGNLRRSENVSLNGPVLLFVLLISIAVGILFGLVPIFKSLSPDMNDSLKQGSRGSSGHHRTQHALVISQIALTLVLLAAASLLFRTIRDLWKTDPGFKTANLITFKIGRSASNRTPAAIRSSYQQLMERIRSIPGVESADSTNVVPLNQMNNFAPFWIGTHQTSATAEAPRLLMYWTGDDYLQTMKIQLLQGRYFSADDSANSDRVIVVDNVFASTYFPHQNPIGQSVTVNLWGAARIIGVVGHIHHFSMGDSANISQPQAYASIDQFPGDGMSAVYGYLTIMVRSSLGFSSIMPAIKNAVYSTSGDQPIYEIHTMHDIISESMLAQQFPMTLLAIFAALALLLAAVGIYGVISYSMQQRTQEIGIRMALGAARWNVFQIIIGEGAKLALLGIVIGAVAALALTRTLSSFSHLLYGVKASDPLTFIAVSLILAVVAIFACYIPARRATRIDPMIALRHD